MRIAGWMLLPVLLPLALGLEQFSGGKYISPDHSFELTIPAGYRIQTGREKESSSYIPVCHDESLVCVTFPRGRYEGTTFGDASVEVSLLPAKTEKTCLLPEKSPDSEFQIDSQNPSRIIDGARFLHSFTEGAAMSHNITVDAYRGYKDGRCYELTVQIGFTNFAVYPPGAIKEFTKQDQSKVHRQLMQILDSFRSLPQTH